MMDFSEIIAFAAAALIAITFHEAAHGFVARHFGDDTAQKLGRVTLNPFKHIDLFGTIILPGVLLLFKAPFLFGYAKPVPVNPYRLFHPKRDMIWVALAGPLMNIFLAFVSLLFFHLLPSMSLSVSLVLSQFLTVSVFLNLTLAIFNLWPLPPLDGGRVIVSLLPSPYDAKYAKVEPFGIWIVLAILMSSALFNLKLVHWLLLYPRQLLLNMLSFLSGVAV